MKVKPKGRKAKKAGSVTNGRGKGNSKNVDLSTLSVDDFMNSTFDESGDSDIVNDNNSPDYITRAMNEDHQEGDLSAEDEHFSGEDENEDISEDVGSDASKASDDESVGNSDGAEDSDGSNVFDGYTHKKSLEKLRDTDPEFYKYLEQNDRKLLQFSVSDSEDEAEEEEEDQVHKPVQDLEVASDESDFEADDKPKDEHVVTLKMVKDLEEKLHNSSSIHTTRCAVKMFHSALQRVTSPQDEDTEPAEFVVEGSSVFNAVVQLCVLEIQAAFKRCLNLSSTVKGHVQLTKCKKWKKMKPLLNLYLTDLVKFLANVSSSHILAVLLKHLHQLAMFMPYFTKLRRPLLKRLVSLWGSGEETVRVLAFLCLLKVTTRQQKALLEPVLKMMYLTYVRNCKFVSPSTLPSVRFMRQSLAEMFALDEAASYRHVFLYVRQLAIHLRTAVTLCKKENIQAVYNWQFVQSLHLWTEVLEVTAHRPHLQPLLYPLVQIIIGTIKLVPTAQYYPLRFHCVQMLINLSKQTGTFIPVLPFILEVLSGFNFNKPHKKVSMKPQDFTCILRLSKSQLQENGFKDAVVEKMYQQLLEYLASEAHTISFPDTVVAAIIQLKKFVKECKSPNYSRKLKQILEKIEENARVIEIERRKVSVSLSDRKAVDAWETNLKLNGTPLAIFYESWNKVNLQQMAKRATGNDKLGEYNIPTLKKHEKKRTNPQHDDGPAELFPSSDESDDDVGLTLTAPPKKKQRGTRGGKGREKVQKVSVEDMENATSGEEDIVQDLQLSEFE